MGTDIDIEKEHFGNPEVMDAIGAGIDTLEDLLSKSDILMESPSDFNKGLQMAHTLISAMIGIGATEVAVDENADIQRCSNALNDFIEGLPGK